MTALKKQRLGGQKSARRLWGDLLSRPKIEVCWISAGVSSFIAGYMERDLIDNFLYIDVADQHPDSIRFIKDCEAIIGKKIEMLRSKTYKCVGDVCRARSFINSSHGAQCTELLKKRVRKEWEYAHRDYDITYVWGFDKDETERADRILESMPQFEHKFPLIERGLSKADAHGICAMMGIKRPVLYDMGYSNNNCIGCVKGGIGYWNRIRVDFPEVFADRAKMEREIGHSIIHTPDGMLFLDELDPKLGRMSDEIMEECSVYCQVAIEDKDELPRWNHVEIIGTCSGGKNQKSTSADTSRKQVASTFTSYKMRNTDRVLDWGGGAYDLCKVVMESVYPGVYFEVVDPYNRTMAHNSKVLKEFMQRKATVLTLNNVLNVIDNVDDVRAAIAESKKYLCDDGVAYFSIYEGDPKTGVITTDGSTGKYTSDGWQWYAKTEWFAKFVREYYKYVKRINDNIIVASDAPIDPMRMKKMNMAEKRAMHLDAVSIRPLKSRKDLNRKNDE